MPRCLELFCGTKSVGKAFEKLGWEVISLDMDPKANPTICCDIMSWFYPGAFPQGHFDFIHASPPCTHYSIARTTGGPRDLEGADAIVQRTLDIIHYFRPMVWTLENPQTGLLKTRGVVEGYPFVDACYCRYSDGVNHRYRKATRFWGNSHWIPRSMRTKRSPCEHVVDGRHPCAAQRFKDSRQTIYADYKHDQNQLYSIPVALCDELAKEIHDHLVFIQSLTVRPPSPETNPRRDESPLHVEFSSHRRTRPWSVRP